MIKIKIFTATMESTLQMLIDEWLKEHHLYEQNGSPAKIEILFSNCSTGTTDNTVMFMHQITYKQFIF